MVRFVSFLLHLATSASRTFRQITGPCGVAVDDSDLLSWEAHYDGSTDHAEDDPPTEGDAGR